MLAWIFVPFYYHSGVFTMPEFLERRFDVRSRYVLSIVSLITFIVSKIAVGIFAGGVVFGTLLPETGDLAVLGPPMIGATNMAVADINRAEIVKDALAKAKSELDALDRDHFQPRNPGLWLVRLRNDRALEPQLRRFLQSLLPALHGPGRGDAGRAVGGAGSVGPGPHGESGDARNRRAARAGTHA